MFPTATPRKKRRGRQPPAYGPVRCPWTYDKLRFNIATGKHYCKCGWRE